MAQTTAQALGSSRTLRHANRGVFLADNEYTFVLGSVAVDGQLDELVDALIDEAAETEDHPGLVGYDILRPLEPSHPVLLVSTWDSEESFEEFMASASDAADASELVAGSTSTEYETVASYAVVTDDELEDDDAGEDDEGDGEANDVPDDDVDDEEDDDDVPGSAERMFAVDLFNATWDLLESEDRTAEDDRTMLGAALASRLHWRHVGEPKNFSVSDWQVSRVFAVLGDVARAKEYGESALEIAAEYGLGPFYVGYAEEALARAAALEGNGEDLAHWMARARASLDDLDDADARELLETDLNEIDGIG